MTNPLRKETADLHNSNKFDNCWSERFSFGDDSTYQLLEKSNILYLKHQVIWLSFFAKIKI